ncbi:1036_t:CDS:2 [Funneliformis geosporum]|uniref:1036_t:CDS:1 n=1 Tax=Funneliformis geosporum TaxID=1117311 RepID=A0A9W4STR0_9GLOM|nr:1036_t:CDS:2 [Funneliformis geosporum]
MSPELDNFSSMNASTTNIDTTSNDANTLENFHLTVNITALIFGHIDLIACSLVIYSAYVRWRTSSLAISSRVPLYLSISDVLQYLVFMPNFFYSLIFHKAIPETTCKILAYLFFLQININMILMAGPAKYWCLTSATTDNPLNTLIIGVIVTFAITFITTCYSYIKTLSMIFNVDREEISTSMDRVNRRNKLERQTTLKILIYISIYIKWIPLMLYGICTMSGYDEALWMHIFAITGFHLGGIYNCILYLMNEGIRRSNKDLTLCALENRSFNQSDYQPPQQSKSQDPESINIID